MTEPLSPKCLFSACQESALSFSDHCWDHCDKDTYSSTLKPFIDAIESNRPTRLNFKKAHLSNLDFHAIDLSGSSFSQANITNSSLTGVVMTDADFIGSRLGSCDFVGCDLSRTNFTRVNISSSSFSHSDLRSTYFAEAHMRDVDFMGAMLFDSVLWNADLSGAKHIKMMSFSNPDSQKKKPSIHLSEKNAMGAYESYRNIKHHFYRNGLFEDGGWASYRQLTMERKHFKEKKDLRYLPSLMMSLLSGYTEKPNRVIISSLVIVFGFAFAYYTLNLPVSTTDFLNPEDHISLIDSVYFSFITFTTVGYGDLIPRPISWFRLLVCMEAFSGPFMAGLYIFTLTRRYSAS